MIGVSWHIGTSSIQGDSPFSRRKSGRSLGAGEDQHAAAVEQMEDDRGGVLDLEEDVVSRVQAEEVADDRAGSRRRG